MEVPAFRPLPKDGLTKGTGIYYRNEDFGRMLRGLIKAVAVNADGSRKYFVFSNYRGATEAWVDEGKIKLYDIEDERWGLRQTPWGDF